MNDSRLKELMLNDDGFAFDPRTGLTFNISVTGLQIINLLKQGMSDEEIVRRIQDEYEVDQITAERDFTGFVNSLRRLSWVASNAIDDDEEDSGVTSTSDNNGTESPAND